MIRDFAGPYYVSEDEMAFGKPTKYWRLDLEKIPHGSSAWDKGVIEASNIYKKRMVTSFLAMIYCSRHTEGVSYVRPDTRLPKSSAGGQGQ